MFFHPRPTTEAPWELFACPQEYLKQSFEKVDAINKDDSDSKGHTRKEDEEDHPIYLTRITTETGVDMGSPALTPSSTGSTRCNNTWCNDTLLSLTDPFCLSSKTNRVVNLTSHYRRGKGTFMPPQREGSRIWNGEVECLVGLRE